jgi:O-antigen biosynthesis protein
MKTVDVIIPIYRGRAELQRCLESLLRHPQQTPHQLILIDDASPEPEMKAYLGGLQQAHPGILVLENPANLGFVGTVNRGMALHGERDLVLLNSDTEVANDWLDRLVACAYAGERVGTVTPFSNNATICSFPHNCESNELPAGWDLESLDLVFREVNRGEAVEVPTGVGFCMYIRRDCLREVGLFDEARFGRGYGEENDFCRRAAAAGWRNLLCCDTFVFHEGAVSFTHEKQERVENALRVLDRLYPDYHRLVYEHIAQDPAQPARYRARIELLRRSPRHRVLFVTHHLGGGTAKHLRELAAHLRNEMDTLVIKPVRDGVVSLDLDGGRGIETLLFALPQELPGLVYLLRHIGLSRIHFHHTLGVETSIWGLPAQLGVPCDVTLHDYHFINANPTQTDAKGRFRADPAGQSSNYPLPVPLAQWQANQRPLLEAAERVIAPSGFAVELYRRHFPNARYRVAFHPEWEQQAPYPAVTPTLLGAEERLRVLVFGAISLEKGADLLEAVANLAAEQVRPLEFHLIGYAYRPLDRSVREHGPYDEAGIITQIQALGPHLVWFPALWPETYSYTLSEALMAGTPILAPDLGAFPERLQGRPLTWVRPWDAPPEAWLDCFERIAADLRRAGDRPQSWEGQPGRDEAFYRHQYLADTPPPQAAPAPLDAEWLAGALALSRALAADQRQVGRRERLLVMLVRLRQRRMGRLVSRLIPVALQRRVKRNLSRRPIHELI